MLSSARIVAPHHSTPAGQAHANARARARSRPVFQVIEGQPDWLPDAALAILVPLFRTYVRTGRFTDALDGAEAFAMRPNATGDRTFRHFDPRLTGTIAPRQAEIGFAGATAIQVMRDVVSSYCTGIEGQPKRAQVTSGGRTVHLATLPISGDRVIRHVCYDGAVTEVLTGERVKCAKLVLRPVTPPLALTDEMRVGD
ncbi:MAG: hypothetical protein AAF390_01530 [Pseudomonadota bacterium]